MKKFLEMIEIAKREGVLGVTPDGKATRFKNLGELKDKSWWSAIEQCNPFVFSASGEAPTDLGKDAAPVHGVDERSLDAPFEVFSIEVLGSYICIPRPQDELKMYIDCILVREVSPKHFVYLSLCETRELGRSSRFLFASNSEGLIVESFLKRLKKEAVGVEHIRERVKIDSGANKRIATFRKIVHVRPKSQISSENPETRNIDWSHRWAVRGHWRAIQGLGKDREGNYCIENMTWVSEYEKGPEDAPLISKVRVVN